MMKNYIYICIYIHIHIYAHFNVCPFFYFFNLFLMVSLFYYINKFIKNFFSLFFKPWKYDNSTVTGDSENTEQCYM